MDKKLTKEYQLWHDMTRRCDPFGSQQKRQPRYIGCTVHADFQDYQQFARWCHTQPGFNCSHFELDKDILFQGNKVYGPDTCCFVPRSINILLTHKKSEPGLYPTGVCLNKPKGLFQATISIAGKKQFIGYFDNPDDASNAYVTVKTAEIHRQAEYWKVHIRFDVYTALINYIVE